MLGPGGFCIVLGLLQLQWVVEAMQVRCWRSFLPRVIFPVVRMSNPGVDSSGVGGRSSGGGGGGNGGSRRRPGELTPNELRRFLLGTRAIARSHARERRRRYADGDEAGSFLTAFVLSGNQLLEWMSHAMSVGNILVRPDTCLTSLSKVSRQVPVGPPQAHDGPHSQGRACEP